MVTAAFAAVPLMLAAIDLSYTDAFFEAMSGITTTGATVIVGLDTAPPGILLWRALLQWMGGIGIIVLALSILPMLQVGGMQLFRMELSEKSDKVLPQRGPTGDLDRPDLPVLHDAVRDRLPRGGDGLVRRGRARHDDDRDRRLFHGRCIAGLFRRSAGGTGGHHLHADGSPALRAVSEGFARRSPAVAERHSGPVVPDHRGCGGLRHGGPFVVGPGLSSAGGDPAGGVQCGFGHYGHGLCHVGFRDVGQLCRRNDVLPDVRRRMRRIDHLRDQDLPLSGAVFDGAMPRCGG